MIRKLIFLLAWLPAMLQAAATLTVALEKADNRPFEYLDGNGHLTGFHVEVISGVCQQLGWQLRFKPLPWKRAEIELASGQVDAVSYMASTPVRQRVALFLPGNRLHLQQVGVFVLRTRLDELPYQPPLVAMVKRYRFGAANNYFYSQEINNLINLGAVETSATTALQLMDMLQARRYDMVFATLNSLLPLKESNAELMRQIVRVPGVAFNPAAVYLAFTRQGHGVVLAEDFSRAYATFRGKPAYRQLADKYGVAELLPDWDKPLSATDAPQ